MKLRKSSFNKILESKNFKKIELPQVVQSKNILKRSGETFRKYMFSFYDKKNLTEWALRPDMTICSAILMKNIKKRRKIYYEGNSYQMPLDKLNSPIKRQQGFEIFYSKNKHLDDKEILETSLKILKNSNFNKKAVLKLNNIEIFDALINRLENLPKRWRERIRRHLSRRQYFNQLLKKLSNNSVDQKVVEKDKRLAKKLRKRNQQEIYAGRSLKEILDRFDIKMQSPRTIETKKNSKIINDYLKIECPIEEAPKKLNEFFKKNNLNLVIGSDYFPLKKNYQNNVKILFSTDMGRNVEYYTGMAFQADIKFNGNKVTYLSGGRFDQLLKFLGYKNCPAVGAAVNLNLV